MLSIQACRVVVMSQMEHTHCTQIPQEIIMSQMDIVRCIRTRQEVEMLHLVDLHEEV